jgi:uncharacterized transporter YbjL
MFQFAVANSAGPQFFPALKKDGVPQVVFSLMVCASGITAASSSRTATPSQAPVSGRRDGAP